VSERSWVRGVARASAWAVGALAVAAASSTTKGRRADRALFDALNRGHGPQADAVFTGVTELGSIMASAGAAAVLAAGGRRRVAGQALVAAGAMWLLGQGLKRVLRRPRPYDAEVPDGGRQVRRLVDKPNGTSWPSSHPAVLLAFVTVAGPGLVLSRRVRAGLAALAAAVGVSRVYVGVHYPSDVVGGLVLGAAVASLVDGIDIGSGRRPG
jgi:membrane-associated phospholipid phosphatase